MWSHRTALFTPDQSGLLGFMPSYPGWWNWAWGYWFGGALWDGVDTITADSPENIRAFEWVQSYADRYGVGEMQVFQSGFGNWPGLTHYIVGTDGVRAYRADPDGIIEEVPCS